MHQLIRRVALGLTLPLAVGAPALLLAAPAQAFVPEVVVSAPSSIVYGQPVTATAQVSMGGEPLTGSVQFYVQSTGSEAPPFGDPVPLDADGKAVSPVLTDSNGLPLGITIGSDAWQVYAVFHDGADQPAGESTSTFISVTQSESTVAVLPTATTLVADVTGSLPGGTQTNSLKPVGAVQFTVNGQVVASDVPVVDGRASLDYVLLPGSQSVTASYSGDPRYTGTSRSATRNDPTISARVLSVFPKTKKGWYHSPVDVWFICRPQGSELVEDCPADLTLRKSGKNQSVTRTIHAIDGGSATVTVSGIDIDRDKPVITVKGRTCSATDELSGLKGGCHMKISASGSYRAIATDRAGNRAVKRGVLG